MDRVRSHILKMCEIDLDLFLSKETVLRDVMDHDSNFTKWVDKMLKVSGLVGDKNSKKRSVDG